MRLYGLVLALGLASCDPCEKKVDACLECGLAGGCAKTEEACADDPCSDEACQNGTACSPRGVCEQYGCL